MLIIDDDTRFSNRLPIILLDRSILVEQMCALHRWCFVDSPYFLNLTLFYRILGVVLFYMFCCEIYVLYILFFKQRMQFSFNKRKNNS